MLRPDRCAIDPVLSHNLQRTRLSLFDFFALFLKLVILSVSGTARNLPGTQFREELNLEPRIFRVDTVRSTWRTCAEGQTRHICA